MKKNIFISLCLVLALMSSCKQISKKVLKLADATVGTQMDSEDTYKIVVDLLGDIDPEWKVYAINVRNQGMEDECKNTFDGVWVRFINAEGATYLQNLHPVKVAPSIDDRAPKGMTFNDLPAIDFTVEKAMKIINDCKAKIPEGYKFLNLDKYQVEYSSKEKGFVTSLTINIQEEGKETVKVNGTQTGVYYKLYFYITPDGNIEMKEG
ncbi:MAG: hypothetical protein J6C05_04870 [Prevotella sp.]|nr:hypothetical protein [Prevotella sp.]MBO5156448.1 hypothetical protein [Prevotella sp.]